MSAKMIVLLTLSLFLIGMVSATNYVYNDPSLPKIVSQPSTAAAVDNNTLNVNNSQYLQGLTPSQVAALFSSPWLYNQTQSAYFYNMTPNTYYYNQTVSTTPAGVNMTIQYNNNGAFGSDGNFTWNTSTKVMYINDGMINVTERNPTGFALFTSGTVYLGGSKGNVTSTLGSETYITAGRGINNSIPATSTQGAKGGLVNITGGMGGNNVNTTAWGPGDGGNVYISSVTSCS